MVQLIKERLKGFFEVGKIHHPASLRARFAADMNLDAEGVAVHAAAFVPLWNIGQEVGRFDLENAKYIHAAIVRTDITRRKP